MRRCILRASVEFSSDTFDELTVIVVACPLAVEDIAVMVFSELLVSQARLACRVLVYGCVVTESY
jgi:hypothetical protein